MRIFIEEYGRILITVLLVTVLISVGVIGFMQKWREEGGVPDGQKTEFATDEGKRTPPHIIARDFKVCRGENMPFEDYVSVTDFDGSDLFDQLQMEYEEREPGIRYYELSVKSPVTGKTAKGKLVVLLDCPRQGGDGLQCE